MAIITELKTTLLQVPLARPLMDATATWQVLGGCFVQLRTDDGHEGLGWSGASAAVREVIERTLKSIVMGSDPLQTEGLWQRMFWALRSSGRKGIALSAISAVDIALWDLKAKLLGVPLYRLLGPCRASVPTYGSGGWTSLTERDLLAEMTGYLERGMSAVKMKIAKDFGQNEAEDLRRVAAVRRAIGANAELFVDANNGYLAKQALRIARRLEQYDIGWLEEPVIPDDYEGMATICRATTIPVAAGENEYSKFGFKELVARACVDIVQPDVGRVGGISEWLKVAHLAEAFNLPVSPHAVQLVHLHLACATPNLKAVEIIGAEEDYCRELFVDMPPHKDGSWSPFSDRPGLGLELNQHAVQRYAK
ncbi:MAG: mandelate racemase/muconate lactonizing enzyme family protein [Chloroflexota bacterium]